MTAPATEPSNRILVVDDEPDICEIVQVNLEGAGYRVSVAHDGLEGLVRARAERPDLIILDVLMPELSGWEVLRQIESDPLLAGTPVIMLTCRSEDADILRGLEEGAVEYITKPFYPEDVVASAKLLLGIFDRTKREERRRRLIAQRQRLSERLQRSRSEN